MNTSSPGGALSTQSFHVARGLPLTCVVKAALEAGGVDPDGYRRYVKLYQRGRLWDGGKSMTFIRTIAPQEAGGLLKELYDHDEKSLGFVANYTKALSLHPEILAAWRNFFSKLLDAVGAEPDAAYQELESALREALTVGRAFPP